MGTWRNTLSSFVSLYRRCRDVRLRCFDISCWGLYWFEGFRWLLFGFCSIARAYRTRRTMQPSSPPMPTRSSFMSNYLHIKSSKFISYSHHSSSCDEACNPCLEPLLSRRCGRTPRRHCHGRLGGSGDASRCGNWFLAGMTRFLCLAHGCHHDFKYCE